MPVPQLSTAFDPRTGRRIVPNEPLIGLARSYLTTNQNAHGSKDTRPYVDDISPLPDLESPKAPSTERWPSSDAPVWQTDIKSGPGDTTARPANSEPTPEAAIGEYLAAATDKWMALMRKRTAPNARHRWPRCCDAAANRRCLDTVGRARCRLNFILANAGDPELPQAEQRMPPPQDQPTEPKNPITPQSQLAGCPNTGLTSALAIHRGLPTCNSRSN